MKKMYSTLPTHFRAYSNVQLIIHSSRVWNSTKVQMYLTDVQTRFLRKPCVVWQNFVLHFQLITYIPGRPVKGREGESEEPKVSVGYTYVCRPGVQCIQIARKRVGSVSMYIYMRIGDG